MFFLLKFAFRNVLRNSRRTILSGLSIMFAVMIVIYMWSFIMGMMGDVVDLFVQSTSGHIRVVNTEYLKREKMLPLNKNIANYQKVLDVVEKTPGVKLVTPRIKFGVLMEREGKNKPVFGIGIDPEKEEQAMNFSKKIIEGRPIMMGKEEANVGALFARDFGLKVGDTLTVVTQTAHGSISAMNLKVAGIFSFGAAAIDRRTFYMPIDKAQYLLDIPNRVTEIFVLLKNENKAPMIAAMLDKEINASGALKYKARAWQEQGFVFLWMMMAKYIYMTIYAIILFFASFTILNTMFMAVMERAKEIGMMKAMGMRNSQVKGVVLLEAAIIGFFSSMIGAFFGGAISYGLSVAGIAFGGGMEGVDMAIPMVMYGKFSLFYIFVGFLMGILFSIIAAIFPALRAAKFEPAEALREI
ncbi:ABC transporter permease [bacterium]|nr:ABC transporter permease [bacterium]